MVDFEGELRRQIEADKQRSVQSAHERETGEMVIRQNIQAFIDLMYSRGIAPAPIPPYRTTRHRPKLFGKYLRQVQVTVTYPLPGWSVAYSSFETSGAKWATHYILTDGSVVQPESNQDYGGRLGYVLPPHFLSDMHSLVAHARMIIESGNPHWPS